MLNKNLYRASYTITSEEYSHIKPITIFIRSSSLDEAISESKDVFDMFVKEWGLDHKPFTYSKTIKLARESELQDHIGEVDHLVSGRTLN